MNLFLKFFTSISLLLIVLIFSWFNLFVSEQSRDIAPFNSIYVSGPINVYLTHAERESVSVKSDNNIAEQIIVEVINGDLRIYNKGKIKHERVLDVYVNYVQIDSIRAKGASNITSYGIIENVSDLLVKASGASEVKLQLNINSLNLIMSNSANVQLAGFTNNFNLKINHVGDLMAYNLVSKNCKAFLDTGNQSPGIARVNVLDTLSIDIKGPRRIKYKGNPIVIQNTIKDNKTN